MAHSGVKAALIALVAVLGIAGCSSSGSTAAASGATSGPTSSATATSPSPSATESSPSPSESATSAPYYSSSSSVPSTTESTPLLGYVYDGKDPDVCPWVKAGVLAKALQHEFVSIKVSTSASKATTCEFQSTMPTADLQVTPMACDITYIGAPGANTVSYFNSVLAQNNLKSPKSISGLGVKAVFSDLTLYVLTKHGVAVIAAETSGDQSQALDIKAFHAAEHSF